MLNVMLHVPNVFRFGRNDYHKVCHHLSNNSYRDSDMDREIYFLFLAASKTLFLIF